MEIKKAHQHGKNANRRFHLVDGENIICYCTKHGELEPNAEIIPTNGKFKTRIINNATRESQNITMGNDPIEINLNFLSKGHFLYC